MLSRGGERTPRRLPRGGFKYGTCDLLVPAFPGSFSLLQWAKIPIDNRKNGQLCELFLMHRLPYKVA